MDIDKKITLEKIKQKKKDWEEHYQSLKAQQKKEDDYYELVYKAGIPTALGYPQRTPRTARDWVDFGVRHFTLDKPRAVVPSINTTDTARKQSIMLEDFYNYWLPLMILQIKGNGKLLLLRGESFFKISMDDTYFGLDTGKMSAEEREEMEAKKLVHFPLIVAIPDPINVLCSPVHDGMIPLEVIESYKKTVAEVVELCKRNSWEWDAGSKKSTDTVDWTSYYSATERCFMADDKPLLTPEIQPNILGFTPYVHIPSGYGNVNFEGKPEYLYRSVLYGNLDTINLFTRALSQVDAILSRYAWPRPKLSGDLEIIERLWGKDGKGFTTNPMEPIVEPTDVTITMESGEQTQPALFQYLGTVAMLAEPPPVLGGQRPPGIYSGFGAEVLMAGAKPIYKDTLKNLEDGLAVLLGMGARIMEKVANQKLAIRGTASKEERYLEPEKIKGYYYNEVHLLAEPPEASDMRKTLGTNLQKAEVISHRTNLIQYQDMSGEEADDEMTQIYAEKGMKSPAIEMALALAAAERLGVEKAKEIMKAGAGGTPAEGITTETPTGTQSVPRHKRMVTGLESTATPGEAEVAGLPLEG